MSITLLLMTPPALRATFPAKLERKRSLTPDPADLVLPRHATMFCLVLLLGYFTCAFKAGLAQTISYQKNGRSPNHLSQCVGRYPNDWRYAGTAILKSHFTKANG
jgi:hypothetical protein